MPFMNIASALPKIASGLASAGGGGGAGTADLGMSLVDIIRNRLGSGSPAPATAPAQSPSILPAAGHTGLTRQTAAAPAALARNTTGANIPGQRSAGSTAQAPAWGVPLAGIRGPALAAQRFAGGRQGVLPQQAAISGYPGGGSAVPTIPTANVGGVGPGGMTLQDLLMLVRAFRGGVPGGPFG